MKILWREKFGLYGSYYCNTVMRIQSFMDFSDPQKMVTSFQISVVVTVLKFLNV